MEAHFRSNASFLLHLLQFTYRAHQKQLLSQKVLHHFCHYTRAITTGELFDVPHFETLKSMLQTRIYLNMVHLKWHWLCCHIWTGSVLVVFTCKWGNIVKPEVQTVHGCGAQENMCHQLERRVYFFKNFSFIQIITFWFSSCPCKK